MKKKLILPAVAVILLIACIGAILVAGSGNLEDKSGWQRAVYSAVNREQILNTKYEGTISDYIWSPDLEYRAEDYAVLQKTPGEDFVIMNVTDLHISDYTLDAVLTIRSFAQIRDMVEEIQPDMITLSGDIFSKESTVYSAYRIRDFLDSLGIPWALVFGNHDDEGNCDLNYLADILMQGQYCVMQKGDPSMGVGNYVVNIREGKRLVHSVILMDTHRSGEIYENQLAWFEWAASGAGASSTVITHIPIAQYQELADALWDSEQRQWDPEVDAFGAIREDPCPYETEDGAIDCGLFDSMKALGTKAMICGHDHTNTACVNYDGVLLAYSLRLGLGMYFDNENFECQGVTTLCIHSDGEVTVEHYYQNPYDVKMP